MLPTTIAAMTATTTTTHFHCTLNFFRAYCKLFVASLRYHCVFSCDRRNWKQQKTQAFYLTMRPPPNNKRANELRVWEREPVEIKWKRDEDKKMEFMQMNRENCMIGNLHFEMLPHSRHSKVLYSVSVYIVWVEKRYISMCAVLLTCCMWYIRLMYACSTCNKSWLILNKIENTCSFYSLHTPALTRMNDWK